MDEPNMTVLHPIQAFIWDVFDREVDDVYIARYVDKQNNELDLNAILRDPLVIKGLAFREVWHMLFKTYPSFMATNDYLMETPDGFEPMLGYMAKRVPITSLLLSNGGNQQPLLNALRQTYHDSKDIFQKNTSFVKHAIAKKMCYRFGAMEGDQPSTSSLEESGRQSHNNTQNTQNTQNTSSSNFDPFSTPTSYLASKSTIKLAQVYNREWMKAKHAWNVAEHDTVVKMYEAHKDIIRKEKLDVQHTFTDTILSTPSFDLDKSTSICSIFDAITETSSKDSSLYILLHGAHVLFLPESITSQSSNPHWQLLVNTVLEWMHQSLQPKSSNLLLIANSRVLDALGTSTGNFNIHRITLCDDVLYYYLPKIARTCVVLGPTAPKVSLSCPSSSYPTDPQHMKAEDVWFDSSLPSNSSTSTPKSRMNRVFGKHVVSMADLFPSLASSCGPPPTYHHHHHHHHHHHMINNPEFLSRIIHTYLSARHNINNSNNNNNNNNNNNTYLFYKFILDYYCKHRRSIDECLTLGHGSPESAVRRKPYAVIIIDNRPNIMNVISAKITLSNLDVSKWDLVVLCDKNDRAFYERYFGPHGNVMFHSEVMSMPIKPERFAMTFYNRLLKSVSLWETLSQYERVLMIQDDGMLLKRGLDDDGVSSHPQSYHSWMTYDYVGAVWDKAMPYNKYMESICPSYIGNGGLSLRNPKAMMHIAKKYEAESRALHFDGLQEIPEDIFFSRYCTIEGFKLPTYENAQRFASEQILNADAFGIHKCWPYHSYDQIKAFFETILTSS
jgi:hypothetical protein